MSTAVFVNFGGTTGYKMAETCNVGMNDAQLLKALAEPASDFSPLFAGVTKVLCKVYLMGTVEPTTPGSAEGIALHGKVTPLHLHGGAAPDEVYLYVDTTKAKGEIGNILSLFLSTCTSQPTLDASSALYFASSVWHFTPSLDFASRFGSCFCAAEHAAAVALGGAGAGAGGTDAAGEGESEISGIILRC